MDFKDELALIKDVIIKKFENQKYLGVNKVFVKCLYQENSWRSRKQGTNKIKNNLKNLGRIKIGSKAPEISIQGAYGKITKLSSLRGNVVSLLILGLLWCRPCGIERIQMW